ncbi:MAG: hypothetical protein ACK4Z4_04365 [Ferrovibrio sp.]
MTNQVAKFFEEYKAIPGANKTFAVSVSGQAAGASHCGPSGRYGDASSSLDEGRCNTEFSALNYCRTKSGGSPCFIYAWGNDVVWGGSEKVAPQQAVTTPPKENIAPVTAGNQVRKFVAIWEGVAGPISGEIKVETNSTAAVVSLSGSNNLSCEGLANFGKDGNGSWVLRCKDDMILSGTLRELPTKTILGVGRDSKGRQITFSVTST